MQPEPEASFWLKDSSKRKALLLIPQTKELSVNTLFAQSRFGIFQDPRTDLLVGLFLPVLLVLALGALEKVYALLHMAYDSWRAQTPPAEVEG